MRNAQTTKQVTFDEAIRLMEGIRRSNLVMGIPLHQLCE